VKRPDDWDTMNSWAYIYGLQALAAAYADPLFSDTASRAEMQRVGERLAARMEECQSPLGGWGYLEFDPPRTLRQQWATSFTTAAGVIALVEAQRQGFAIDETMIRRAAKAVAHCRVPSGAFTYSIPVIPQPGGMEWVDSVKGSLSRIQVCHEALVMAGQDVPMERLEAGIAHFFREHRFLDAGRNRPIPHEAYYLNSGYFYLFGHYYAARVIERLPEAERQRDWPRLRYEIIKIQQADGSMWDYDMHAYHKPYGTAYSVMALRRSLPEWNDRGGSAKSKP
jgi:hypothetical protein